MISMAQAPLQLSKYKLIEEIGHGGMATVYRARDTRLDRDVALKLIHRHLRQSEEVGARFNSEARVVARLKHPNIVEVYDVSDEDDEARYLIVELIRGPTLRELLAKHGPLPVELAAEIVLELAAALEHAHGIGVIHRDIKPENVLIQPPSLTDPAEPTDEALDQARVKLTDFGIAKLLDAQGVTSTGQVLGSPAHMAPEQIEGKPVDRRADIFSLGVLFYEAIVGCLPFAGKNPAQVLRNVLEGNFQPPELVRPEIGTRWSKIIVRALSREPEDRFGSIEEFAGQVRAELRLVEFEEQRRDITRFLLDPEGYAARFPDRIVRGLSKSGRRGRAGQDRVLATAQFCRALAYKPGDSTLLKQVSGLRRDEQLRRVLGYLGVVAGAGVLVGAVVWFWPEAPPPEPPKPQLQPTASLQPAPKPEVKPPVIAPTASPATTVEPQPAARLTAEPTPPKRHTSPVRSSESDPLATRQVRVFIGPASGGSLRIDGESKQWFGGVIHDLTVGEHVFEFVPPNDTCCQQTRRRVSVPAGDGVFDVRGEVPFKDARLSVLSEASEGWRMACPSLFSDVVALPGQRLIPMSEPQVDGVCTFSNPEEGSDKRQKSISLRAGDNLVLPWP